MNIIELAQKWGYWDGNTVEMSVEQAQYGRAAADYRTSLMFIENRASGIKRALRGE